MLFERLSQINEKYAMYFDERELTPFEKDIFNSNRIINPSNYDLNDIKTLNSLSIYYDIEINKPRSEMKGIYSNNVKNLIDINLKMIALGNSKGALRLTVYYFNEKNIEEAEKYAKIALDINDEFIGLAYVNIGTILANQSKYDEALVQYKNAVKNGQYDVISAVSRLYYIKSNYVETFKWCEYGFYKSDKEALEFFEELVTDPTLRYCHLLSLPFTNDFIEKYKCDLIPRINQKLVDQFRDNNVTSIFITDDTEYIIGSSIELIQIYE